MVATSVALVVMIGYWLVRTIPSLAPTLVVRLQIPRDQALPYVVPLIAGGAALLVLAFPGASKWKPERGCWLFAADGADVLAAVVVCPRSGCCCS